MRPRDLKVQLDRARVLLNELEIIQRCNPSPDYSKITEARRFDYAGQWRFYLSNDIYNFLLTDWSLLQFQAIDNESTTLRYAFFDCPQSATFDYDAYEERAKTYVAREMEDAYGSYLIDECEQKEHVAPIRYDFTPSQYKPGCHPASHLHVGHQNTIRFSTKRIMTPVAFALLVARQLYPTHWKKFIEHEKRQTWRNSIQVDLASVDAALFGDLDGYEIHFE